MKKLVGLCAFLIGFSIPGCGPILDWNDARRGVCGRNLPNGTFKRNFWGFTYFESNPEYYRLLCDKYVPYTAVEPQQADELSSQSP